MRRQRAIGALAGCVLASAAITAGIASGATGDLTYQGCFANTAAAGCSVPADPALDAPIGVAVSPDGGSVYVASILGDSISHFSRAPGAALAYQGCFANTAAAGCSVPADPALDGAQGVAVSPDGGSVYVASGLPFGDGSISHFARAPGGALAYQGCFADSGAAGCSVPGDPALAGAAGVAVSPDGGSVYVASFADDSISHFGRAPGGALAYQGCFADSAAAGCSVPANPALDGAIGVEVSPDGGSVYVASQIDHSISHFTRAPNGVLSFQGCFANSGATGCSVPVNPALDLATGVAVSPDGGSVYVASVFPFGDGSISHFARAPGGALSFQGCFAETAATGCAVPVDPALAGARGVAVSPDGGSVYVASQTDGSISQFGRAPNGALSYQGCLADAAATGCAVPVDPALAGARSVAVSPDGGSVYVASGVDDSTSHFLRELPPCRGRPATRAGTAGRDLIRGTARRDRIAALAGNDVVRGLRGNDVICGGPGRDRLIGGAGRDRLLGQAGRDLLRGGPGRDLLRGGPGRDRQIQ